MSINLKTLIGKLNDTTRQAATRAQRLVLFLVTGVRGDRRGRATKRLFFSASSAAKCLALMHLA